MLLVSGGSFWWLRKEASLSDVDILGRVERRRVWTAQEKAVLLAEIDVAGGKVQLVARQRFHFDSGPHLADLLG
jgi:hypothetical protein